MTNDLCDVCIFYQGELKCKAFAEKIPEEILLGDINHNIPLSDQDNDIVFEKEKE